MAFDGPRMVAAEVAHRQNVSMVILLNARPGPDRGLRPRQRRRFTCCIAAGQAVRANPAFKLDGLRPPLNATLGVIIQLIYVAA